MTRKPRVTDLTAPKDSDPRWAEWSAPLLNFLATPKTWGDIKAWGDRPLGMPMVRQCIAWLLNRGMIFDVTIRDVTHWVQPGWQHNPDALKFISILAEEQPQTETAGDDE